MILIIVVLQVGLLNVVALEDSLPLAGPQVVALRLLCPPTHPAKII